MKRAVAYYRVSTERQGRSGLGLDAQRQLVEQFACGNEYSLIKEVIEMESGKRNSRIGLSEAVQECEKQDATLLIAKLDRLSRRVSFIAALMESGVDFKVVDNPYAERFTLHILAAVAEKEHQLISQRTTDCLAAAKRRGVVLGRYGREVLAPYNRKRAEDYAASLGTLIQELKAEGITTVRAISDELNRRNVKTSQNTGKWHISSVHRLLKRIETINAKQPMDILLDELT